MSIATEYLASAAYSNAGDATGFVLARAYRYWRGHGYPATDALAAARRDASKGTARYPDMSGGTLPAASDRGGVWIERPADYGLRFVGFADELAGRAVDHKGWFTFPGGDTGDVARGAVYALPSRGGRSLFVEALRTGSEGKAGWQDMGTEGSALVFLSDRHAGELGGYSFDADNDSGARDAALGADGEARIYAERECEYQEAYRLGQECAEKVGEADSIREAVRPSLAEIRGLSVNAPNLCATLRRAIGADLERARTLYSEARALWNEHAGESRHFLAHTFGAFEEGASAATFADLRK